MAKITRKSAAEELLRRFKARESLAAFADYVEVPGRPIAQEGESNLAQHHILICDVLQGLMEHTILHNGRVVKGAMLFMPPGSAKSTYANVIAPAFAVGKYNDYNIITTSYSTPLAVKQSRKTRRLIESQRYKNIFDASLLADNSAVEDYSLSNGSGIKAGGIMSGLTGNRADGILIDDPIKGREEADSFAIREKTKDAIDNDLVTRMKPGAWVCYILTRWDEQDPAGKLLPENWSGESGFFECSDGEIYYVLSIPAQCDRADDILGREIGQYIWPEWFPEDHWTRFKSNPRTWSALYQQRPQPEEGTYFIKNWFNRYSKLPEILTYWMSSDFAVSEGKGDFTEHSIWAIDTDDNIYLVDNWHRQTTPDVWIEEAIRLITRYKPQVWFGEGGVIRRAVEPFMLKELNKKRCHVTVEWINPIGDKPSRGRSFQARASMGKIYLPTGHLGDRALDQLIRFPTGKYDDFVDTASLIGLVVDKAGAPMAPKAEKASSLQPPTFNDMLNAAINKAEKDQERW